MGFLSHIKHDLEKVGKKVEKTVSGVIPHVHTAEKRAAMEQAQAQIDYYKQLKDDAANERADYERQKAEDERKLAEKQARNLRRHRRAPGFMADDSENTGSSTLG